MLRSMRDGDQVTVTLAGHTHTFGPDKVRIDVTETATRGGVKHRYAAITITLTDGELPEDMTEHLRRLADQ